MIVSPKFRGFICTTAHPTGCAQNIKEQIEYIKSQKPVQGPKRVLVIGASTGYGLASRIVSTFGCGASTIGVFFERPASGNRTATAGWYNSAAFEKAAADAGYYAKSINGDAFSNEIKEQTVELIKKDLGQIDLVIYSLASPRRVHPDTSETFNSVIKPIGSPHSSKTVDFHTGNISEVTIDPATEEEVRHTVAVMGGQDWEMWLNALDKAGVLAKGALTVAYSYVGPELTHPIYKDGTIGKAKDDLEQSARNITNKFESMSVKAFVSVNKAVVTQSSSAIPIVPLYISILFKIMKEQGIHEDCIEQIYRLYNDRLYVDSLPLDEKGRIRIDDLEMRDDVQNQIPKVWGSVDTDNIEELTDISGYRKDFFGLFGFGHAEVDYEQDVNVEVDIPSLA